MACHAQKNICFFRGKCGGTMLVWVMLKASRKNIFNYCPKGFDENLQVW